MTDAVSTWSPQSEELWQLEVDRCQREIADVERLLRAGHPDISGLCLAFSDWHAELWLLERERKPPGSTPAA